jgi:hypothetical protein
MNARRWARWRQAAAVAPVLLLLVSLPGELMLRCQMDGLLRSACCCSSQEQAQEQDRGPALKAQDCCDPEVTQNLRPPAEAARPGGRDLAVIATVAVGVAPVPLLILPDECLDRAWQRRTPAREGPSIVVLKHAFLI